MLKQPLQTSITTDNLDFEDFAVEEQLHIGISVKDFKAIFTHAETLKTSITALYSFPTRPMQLSYREYGMQCEFTLMTIGEYRGGSVTPAPAAVRRVSAAPAERPQSRQSTAQIPPVTALQKSTTMPPPSEPASRSFTREPQSQRTQRPSPPPPKASLDPESLFIPIDEDEDRVWGERNYDDERDTLGWDASANNVRVHVMSRKRCSDNNSQASDLDGMRRGTANSSRLEPYRPWQEDLSSRIAPTQRISDVCDSIFSRCVKKLMATRSKPFSTRIFFVLLFGVHCEISPPCRVFKREIAA